MSPVVVAAWAHRVPETLLGLGIYESRLVRGFREDGRYAQHVGTPALEDTVQNGGEPRSALASAGSLTV
jgi:hypothetical protein